MEGYLDFRISGDFKKDIKEYFAKYSRQDTYEHTLDVISELYNIEKQFGNIQEGSEIACYYHDLGRVVSNEGIIEFCIKNRIDISEEERLLPSILHQKISAFLAEKVFGVKDKVILDAVRYHTTSRRNPSMTEIEVFLADKMSWKEEEYRELTNQMRKVMKDSKNHAVFYYLSTLESSKENLRLYHSDSKESYKFFYEMSNKADDIG
jgi:predicted HD superfamily hydrolase involved in NAD metabolism